MITAVAYLTALHLDLAPTGWLYFLLVLIDLELVEVITRWSKRDE